VAKATRRRQAKAQTFVPRVVGVDSLEPIYSNFAQIRHTPSEFSLIFCRVSPPDENDVKDLRKKGYIDATTEAVIVMTPEVARSLAAALSKNIQRFEEMVKSLRAEAGGPTGSQ
jgi:hypothetical protein